MRGAPDHSMSRRPHTRCTTTMVRGCCVLVLSCGDWLSARPLHRAHLRVCMRRRAGQVAPHLVVLRLLRSRRVRGGGGSASARRLWRRCQRVRVVARRECSGGGAQCAVAPAAARCVCELASARERARPKRIRRCGGKVAAHATSPHCGGSASSSGRGRCPHHGASAVRVRVCAVRGRRHTSPPAPMAAPPALSKSWVVATGQGAARGRCCLCCACTCCLGCCSMQCEAAASLVSRSDDPRRTTDAAPARSGRARCGGVVCEGWWNWLVAGGGSVGTSSRLAAMCLLMRVAVF